MNRSQVLIVANSPEGTEYLRGLLSSCAITDVVGATESEAVKQLGTGRFYAVVMYLNGAVNGGRELLSAVHRETPTTSVVVIIEDADGFGEWGGTGAFDILTKLPDSPTLLAVLQRALTRRQLTEPAPAKAPLRRRRRRFPDLIGDSPAMQALHGWIGKVASSEANICLYGESGTGKELVARAIHDTGSRRGRPFVVLDCAAIPQGLMESEMFGHVRGAFTSAVADRMGVFQLADTGTLLLDEVAELPLHLQAKLLRVIENREFRRVGSNYSLRVDVRLIAATNRDLAICVQQGRFREDLFYRLDVIKYTLPPLRQRKEDIPLLVDHFVQQFNTDSDRSIRGVSPRTLRLLLQYDWPGNVRELENCIERAGVLAEEDIIDLDLADLRWVSPTGAAPNGVEEGDGRSLRDLEQALILETLRRTQGNKTAAAALLGISRRGLHYKLKRIEGDKTGVATA
jgi:DNA-binding NtrC family response regulator